MDKPKPKPLPPWLQAKLLERQAYRVTRTRTVADNRRTK